MKNTLIVSYTPRIDSNTAKLLQTAQKVLAGKSEITQLDLAETPPELLLQDNLTVLLKRNFMGLSIDATEQALVKRIDNHAQQVVDADYIIIAFPMYNFSLPATVKAWVDNIVQAGKTFTMTEGGAYQGLCHGKKALVLITTGSDFNDPSMSAMNFATPLMQTCFNFMGIESETIHAFGLNQYADREDEIVMQAQKKIHNHLQQYF